MITDYKKEFARINSLLLADSYKAAQTELQRLLKKKLPREALATAANLVRRARWPEKAVQLLHGVVRPERGRLARMPADDFEKAEFGASLRAIGALNEAVEVLAEISHARFPRAGVYLGIAHIVRWDAEAALPVLERALASSKARQFEHTLGRVYLGIALSYTGRHMQRAEEVLVEVLAASENEEQRLVRQAALEALAMHFTEQRAYARANGYLNQLEKLSTSDGDPVFHLLVEQWRCVAGLAKNSGDANVRRRLGKVREAFCKANQWERARGCDFYSALARDDCKALRELYFSSSYVGFRGRLSAAMAKRGQSGLPAEYRWNVPAEGSRIAGGAARVLELGVPGFGSRMPERILQALSSDTYKPFRVAELHELLYPGEYFNPLSSPARIHQNVLRTRGWLKLKQLPALIVERDGYFSLRATAPLVLALGEVLSKGTEKRSRGEVRISGCVAKLRAEFGKAEFSAAQAARVLGESPRSARRHLGAAREKSLLTQLGSGRGARYLVVEAG
ncbi:MAG: hypothetical protein HY074_17960 [Deltaproteobacteria bacterium]|nr:hypothetical protein [Deltaproteobacteria bacterium]